MTDNVILESRITSELSSLEEELAMLKTQTMIMIRNNKELISELESIVLAEVDDIRKWVLEIFPQAALQIAKRLAPLPGEHGTTDCNCGS